MEHQMIAALVQAEHEITARDPHTQRRLDAMRARDRALAARAREEWRARVRVAVARGIRRIAEAVEPPPRPVIASSAPDPC
ncbi:hypothetical protein [Microbacterium sp. EST19A]|uniref:hypothetical protein n=1 Tax=Microbacterium sp. EST19A TaxID=2862681 RepID=UPI001CC13D1F|nr:hypothetical protein [Microbacterium sp. EST19A]